MSPNVEVNAMFRSHFAALMLTTLWLSTANAADELAATLETALWVDKPVLVYVYDSI